jgi:lincosamide nucleotidyltransferase A/C/D/E
MDEQQPVRFTGRAYRRLETSRAAKLLQLPPVQAYRARAHGVRDVGARTVARVLEGLRPTGIDVHLAGGWGVDALLGRQTRLHDDLDLIYEATPGAREALTSVLLSLGFRETLIDHVPQSMFPLRILFGDTAGRFVDLLPIRPIDPGAGCEAVADHEHVVLPAMGAASFVSGRLGRGRKAMAVSCLSTDEQLASRSSYELRDSDRRDIALLQAHAGTGER